SLIVLIAVISRSSTLACCKLLALFASYCRREGARRTVPGLALEPAFAPAQTTTPTRRATAYLQHKEMPPQHLADPLHHDPRRTQCPTRWLPPCWDTTRRPSQTMFRSPHPSRHHVSLVATRLSRRSVPMRR